MGNPLLEFLFTLNLAVMFYGSWLLWKDERRNALEQKVSQERFQAELNNLTEKKRDK